jgi:hypothetical protein
MVLADVVTWKVRRADIVDSLCSNTDYLILKSDGGSRKIKENELAFRRSSSACDGCT